MLVSLAACSGTQPARAHGEELRGSATAPRAAATHGDGPAADACPVTAGERRLGDGSVLGLPATAPLRELRSRCPSARRDTVGVGGYTAAALRFAAPGVIVDAVQTRYDAYEDTVHLAEPADLWALWGDSLRFADGRLVPMRVGALRSLDSAGVVVIDRGDDGTGSYVVQCRHAERAFVVSNDWPVHPTSGVVPLSTVAPGDTTRVWRIEIRPGERNPEVDAACRRR